MTKKKTSGAKPKKVKSLADIPPVTAFPPLAEAAPLPEQAAEPKQESIPLEGQGVAELSIPEIDKAINKYERKKEARCNASPDEIAAKGELKKILHANRAALPLNEAGVPFYRYEGVDYALEEKLTRKKVDTGDDGEDGE